MRSRIRERALTLVVVLAATCTPAVEVGTHLDAGATADGSGGAGGSAFADGGDAADGSGGVGGSAFADGGDAADGSGGGDGADAADGADVADGAGGADAADGSAGSDAGTSDAGPSVSVGAGDDIFSAGQSGGPPVIAVVPGSVQVTFSAPGSGLSCCAGSDPHDADGGTALSTWIVPSPSTGISGIKHYEKNIFLIGLFMSDTPPDPAMTPPELNYSSASQLAGTSYMLDGGDGPDGGAPTWTWDGAASFAPLLNQTFFIGDGLTGTGSGDTQIFYVPSGATKLYLGFADGLNVGDFTHGLGTPSPAAPGYYSDNTGAVSVSYTFQ